MQTDAEREALEFIHRMVRGNPKAASDSDRRFRRRDDAPVLSRPHLTLIFSQCKVIMSYAHSIARSALRIHLGQADSTRIAEVVAEVCGAYLAGQRTYDVVSFCDAFEHSERLKRVAAGIFLEAINEVVRRGKLA